MSKNVIIGPLFNQHKFLDKILLLDSKEYTFIFSGHYFTFGVGISETLDTLMKLDKSHNCIFKSSIAEYYLSVFFKLKNEPYFWRKGWLNPFCGILPVLAEAGLNKEQMFYSESSELIDNDIYKKLKTFLLKLDSTQDHNYTKNDILIEDILYSIDGFPDEYYSFNHSEVMEMHSSFVTKFIGEQINKSLLSSGTILKKESKYITTITPEVEVMRLEYNDSQEDFRSKSFKSLKETRTIYLKYDFKTPDGFVPVKTLQDSLLWNTANAAFKHVSELYGEGYVVNAFISNLGTGKEIKKHYDVGWMFERTHRFHWALETNDEVDFLIDEINYKIIKNSLWEIDNKKLHSVCNNGDSNRVHLIFDYYVLSENLGIFCDGFNESSEDFRTYNYLHRLKS